MVRTVSSTFAALGLLINVKKSSLVPSQNLVFIGAQLDSTMARAYLPTERFTVIKDLVHTVVHAPTIPMCVCLQLMGHMAAATIVVRNTRLRFCCLQHWLATVYVPVKHSVHRPVVVPQYVRKYLQWGVNLASLLAGVPFHRPQPTKQITDASLTGWGAHMDSRTVQRRWSTQKMLLHISVLELRAVRHACKHFQLQIRYTTTRILTDNVATMFYINRQGGARFPSLSAESIHLWNWCISNNTILTALYIPGVDNLIADSLSRHFPHDHKWEVRTAVLTRIFARWGFPAIDLFAIEYNTKCPAYCSGAGIGRHSLGDAFLLRWERSLLYAFPPVVLISKVLEKINTDRARVILLAPAWAR